ncbi:hypothetical protein MKX03_036329 [Papaver bracteatum]|nr:hypothetical protein MKX03_036329 [Papaver bracteatum]
MANTIYFTSLRYDDPVEQGMEVVADRDSENNGEEQSGADLAVCTGNIYNGLLEKVSIRPAIKINCFCSRSDEEKEDLQKSDTLHVPSTITVVSENLPASEPGWPVWLSSVAGDVTEGWDPLQAHNFEKLNKIGDGLRSTVYKAKDLLTGNFVAIKKVGFDFMDPASVMCMAKEILVLRKLDHPNVMKLEGLITSKMSRSLYLVFEYMEHDLASLSAIGICFSEDQVKSHMYQLLSGLDYCHHRGVVHCNINGSHLLINNNSSMLKIAGFGSASTWSFDQKSMTIPPGRLVYKAPEIFYGGNYGIGVDLWSAGCVLAAFMCDKPIMAAQTEMEQRLMIFKICGITSEEDWRGKLVRYKNSIKETFKEFPRITPSLLALLETLLATDPAERETASAALMSKFFTTGPYLCHDSSFPKYPPKEELVDLKKKKVRSVDNNFLSECS